MKTTLAGFAAACVLVYVIALAQTRDSPAIKTRLEEVAKSYTAGNAFMGAVLVAEGDHILLDQGYGMANLEWNIPNAPDVKFRLGSLTKQFTATLILLLQQDGKLHIEDPVGKYLPDAPNSWEKITLANLLGHTSGIANFTSDRDFGTWGMSKHTTSEEIAFFRDKPLEFEPGSKFAYSNSNYEVLGAVIEKVSNEKYGDLLRKRIFDPIGMHDTGLDTDELILPRRGKATAQTKMVWSCPGRVDDRAMGGGLYFSTTGDLLRWERALFGGKVLNDASLTAMTTAGKGNYGLGVGIVQQSGVKVIQHGGGIEGFNTQLAYVPDRKITVVVLSNVNGGAPGSMGAQLLDVAMGKKVILASERKSVPIAKEELQKFTGVYDVNPIFALTIAVSGDSLTVRGTRQPADAPAMYQGAEGGHPRFFIPPLDAEIEFLPEVDGDIWSLVFHQGGDHPAKKRPAN